MPRSAKLGQNFLVNRGVAEKIVSALPSPHGPIVEVGPGRGILTELLLERGGAQEILLIEVDPTWSAHLAERFTGRVRILTADVLGVSLAELFPGRSVQVIGNFPYYISRRLAAWLIANHSALSGGVAMLQKEFVDKLLPAGDGPAGNAQAALFHRLFRGRRLFDVQPGSFAPRPRVVSSVFSFHAVGDVPAREIPEYETFLAAAFAERRKTLANNLSHHRPRADVEAALAAAGLEIRQRAESLRPDELYGLFRALSAVSRVRHDPRR